MTLRHTLANGVERSNSPPGGVVDVLVASKDGVLPKGLEHIPFETRVLVDSRPGWGASSNALLQQSADAGHDAIFIDDDVTILPDTFAGFDKYYPLADVFGFRLRGHQGQSDQYGWGLQQPNPFPDRACYLAHITASLMYIRAGVLKDGGLRFPEWPGVHFEDIVFTYDCWLRGYAVAYLPSHALHEIHLGDAGETGATKRNDPNLIDRKAHNRFLFDRWCQENDLKRAANEGRIPFGAWGIAP